MPCTEVVGGRMPPKDQAIDDSDVTGAQIGGDTQPFLEAGTQGVIDNRQLAPELPANLCSPFLTTAAAGSRSTAISDAHALSFSRP